MRFLIIGLGIYGENLARDLTDMGHEVIGADWKQTHIEGLKDVISTVYLVDSTEESQLMVLPLLNVDLVVVAIGENFGASIKTVALLKKAGVKHIYARAIDTLHEAILQSFDIDRILTPEQRAASDLTLELALGTQVETLAVDKENVVINFAAPDIFLGISYEELRKRLADNYKMSLVAASRNIDKTNVLGLKRAERTTIVTGDTAVERGDILTIYGSRKRLRELCREVSA